MWAIAWWVARRYIRRRAGQAVAGIAAGATARRSRIWGILGAVLAVGALVTGLVVWRRLAAAPGDGKAPEMPPIPDVEPVPTATA